MKEITTILFYLIFFVACSHSPMNTSNIRGANIVPPISTQDMIFLRQDWKANTVRILHLTPLNETAPYSINDNNLNDIFNTIDRALELGFTVIFSPGVSMDDHNKFFSDENYKKMFLKLWLTIANRYKNNRAPLIYDLMNEPHDSLAEDQWRIYAISLVEEIRKIDDFHTIMIEPPAWGWPAGFKNFRPLAYDNIVYSFHFYGPMDFTAQRGYDQNNKFIGHMKASEQDWRQRQYPGFIQGGQWDAARLEAEIMPAIEFSKKYKVQMSCGEFGVARWANGGATWFQDMINTLNKYNLGWTYYSFREWQPMDLEMDIKQKNQKTVRGNTPYSEILKKEFSKVDTKNSRHLSEQERSKYNLNGIIHDAKICPTKFDEQSQKHQITGPCETVNCQQLGSDIDCIASPASN